MVHQVICQREDAIAIIRLANPPMNFISNIMLKAFYEELIDIKKDRSIRVLVLTGGMADSFITHYDVSELIEYCQTVKRLPDVCNNIVARIMNGFTRKAHQYEWLDKLIIKLASMRSESEQGIYYWARCLEMLDTMPIPVIAAINGICLGGGCEISLCCDFRFMAKGDLYRIGMPEVLAGIIPGGTGTPLRLPRVVGEANALEMLLTGKLYTPEEALSMGLLNKIFLPEDLMPAVMELAHQLSSSAPVAIASIKKAVRHGSRLSSKEGRIVDMAATNKVMATNDALAGMRWYVEEQLANYTSLDLEDMLDKFSTFTKKGGADVEFRGR